mgnify:CR=1
MRQNKDLPRDDGPFKRQGGVHIVLEGISRINDAPSKSLDVYARLPDDGLVLILTDSLTISDDTEVFN